MLSPIKSFLTYLQKNTNAGTLFTSSSSSMNDPKAQNDTDVAITSSVSSEIIDIDKNEEKDCSAIQTLNGASKAHDQNENEVININNSESNDEIVLIENNDKEENDCILVENPIDTRPLITEPEVIIEEGIIEDSSPPVNPSNDVILIDDYQSDISSNNNSSIAVNTSDLETTPEVLMVLEINDEMPTLNECIPEDTSILLSSENEEQFETSNLRLED